MPWVFVASVFGDVMYPSPFAFLTVSDTARVRFQIPCLERILAGALRLEDPVLLAGNECPE